VAEIISFQDLARQHALNFLDHKRREYQEREDYLARLRKLLFNVEGQMRQAELQQLEVFKEISRQLKIPLKFPDLGDRIGLQEFFTSHPFPTLLQQLFTNRLNLEECYSKIENWKKNTITE
jgi:hypothetical protein